MNKELMRFGGIAGLITLIFIPAIALQQTTGWFPEYDLQAGTMDNWLITIVENRTNALLGVGLFIIAIISFFSVGITLYKLRPQNDWLGIAAVMAQVLGITLALAAFLFGFGFTWALSDLAAGKAMEDTAELIPLATMGMRGFLVSDDLATCLIGLGNGLFGWSFYKNGLLPKWLCWWGIVAGFLVTIVLLRYSIPAFSFATIGYPLVVLWFFIVGIVLIRKSKLVERQE